jgi:hypothetical protein
MGLRGPRAHRLGEVDDRIRQRTRAEAWRIYKERTVAPLRTNTDAARQRRHRERARSGQIPVVVAIDEVGWEVALTEAGLLTEPEPDKAAIGHALSRLLDVLLHVDLATLSRRDNRM